jgi:hypothetical protein
MFWRGNSSTKTVQYHNKTCVVLRYCQKGIYPPEKWVGQIFKMNLTFRGPCIVIYSYNKSQRDELFPSFIWYRTLHVSDRFTSLVDGNITTNVNKQFYYISTTYCIFWNICIILSFLYNKVFYLQHVSQFTHNVHVYTLEILPIFKISVWQIPITVNTVLDSWWWTVSLSETCRALYQNKVEK